MKRVGILPPNHLTINSIKKYLLLFDTIFIDPNYLNFFAGYAGYPSDDLKEINANLNYLGDVGQIEFNSVENVIQNQNNPIINSQIKMLPEIELIESYMEYLSKWNEENKNPLGAGLWMFEVILDFPSNIARVSSNILNSIQSENIYIPVTYGGSIGEINRRLKADLSNTPYIPIEEKHKTNSIDVFGLLFNYFPTPDESVSYEQLIDFKNDDDSSLKFKRIISWSKKISRTDVSESELKEEIEYLLHEYENHMKIHKMKYYSGNFEAILVGTTEIIEDLIKIKWSKIVKKIFNIKRHKVNLLIGEAKAPGKELAYLSKAKEHFDK